MAILLAWISGKYKSSIKTYPTLVLKKLIRLLVLRPKMFCLMERSLLLLMFRGVQTSSTWQMAEIFGLRLERINVEPVVKRFKGYYKNRPIYTLMKVQ